MAEFFFLLRAFRLDGEDKIRRYAELHNQHLETLQADRTKMRRLGLSPTRVQKGRFSRDSIPKLVENYRSGDGAIDQSDLSRLLIEVMSPEDVPQDGGDAHRGGIPGTAALALPVGAGALDRGAGTHLRPEPAPYPLHPRVHGRNAESG